MVMKGPEVGVTEGWGGGGGGHGARAERGRRVGFVELC